MKNPFRKDDRVVVSSTHCSNCGADGYVSRVNGDSVTVKFGENVSYQQREWGYHFSNLQFFNHLPDRVEKEETRNESVWCIFKEKGDAPKKMHSTYQAAKDEMERLAKACPGHRFYLLEAIEELMYEMKYERKGIQYNQYPQE